MKGRKRGGNELYCTNCGNKIKIEAKFCTSCGAPIKNVKEVGTSKGKSEVNHLEAKTNQGGQYESSSRKKNWFNEDTKIRIWTFLFGVFYYIYKGLWKKGLLLYTLTLIIAIVLVFFTQLFNWNESTFFSLRRLMLIGIYATMGPIDIHRKEYNNETMWKELPSVFSKGPAVIAVTVVAVIFNSYLT